MKLLQEFIQTQIKRLVTENTMHDYILQLQNAVHKSAFKPAQAFAPLVQIVAQLPDKEIIRLVHQEEQVLLRKKDVVTKKDEPDKFIAGYRLIPIYISLRAKPNQPEKLLECLEQLKEILGTFPGLPVIASRVRKLQPKV